MTAPDEWFDAWASAELGPGERVGATVCGRAVVIWRTRAGAVSALDAHCPHLGADLAVGGRVDGDELVCPFHGWRMAASGDVVGLGYSARCPQNARLACWDAEERGDRIFVRRPVAPERTPPTPTVASFHEGWYKLAFGHELPAGGTLERQRFGRVCTLSRDTGGTARVRLDQRPLPVRETGGMLLGWYGEPKPAWDPPDLDVYDDPKRDRHFFSEVVGSSLMDIAENPFDSPHLDTLHSLDLIGAPELKEQGPVLHQRFGGAYVPPVLRWLRPVFEIKSSTTLRAWGLGLTVARVEATPGMPTVHLLGANTPVDAHHTEYNLVIVSDPIHGAGKLLFRVIAHQIWGETEPEREIWATKRFAPHPQLTEGERALGRFRRWARQFELR